MAKDYILPKPCHRKSCKVITPVSACLYVVQIMIKYKNQKNEVITRI